MPQSLSGLEADVYLEPGESKDLKVTLKWINSETNLGQKANTAKLISTENVANYPDIEEENDTSEATIIISIKTGEVVSVIIVIMLIISFGISGYMVYISIRRMKNGEQISNIKFLK